MKPNKLLKIVLYYKWIFICAIVGLPAGFWGFFLGLGVGAFVTLILKRKKDAEQLRIAIENPGCQQTGEVFPESVVIAGLAVFCYHDVNMAASQMRACFGDLYTIDWETVCRSAENAETLNGDLLTECLAAKLRRLENSKKTDINSSVCDYSILVERIFKMLAVAEMGWKVKDRGNPPSRYLAELLQYSPVSDEVATACLVLGVKPDDSESTVKKAYHEMVQLYHPDTVRSLSAEQQQIAGEAFLRIQKAYEVLTLKNN